ncbi:hypothetical protein K3495_g8224 [Podosphaera aphanis]|nr:hypothetical protein K3495_g8224 [Podosphaera aphanis]
MDQLCLGWQFKVNDLRFLIHKSGKEKAVQAFNGLMARFTAYHSIDVHFTAIKGFLQSGEIGAEIPKTQLESSDDDSIEAKNDNGLGLDDKIDD